MKKNTVDNRLKKYIKILDNNCWLWSGAMSKNNPVLTIESKSHSVRTLLFKKYFPDIIYTGNLKIFCLNKKCVNPNHIITKEQWFESLIKKNEASHCWEWQGQSKGGYGFFYFNKKSRLVHRLMYERYIGKIPEKINVCHSCDNPICCNPEHLFLGTQLDNVKDMITKGRATKSKGVNHHKAKITEQDVRNIRKKKQEGLNMKQIERELNLSYRIIQRVCNNQNWSHII